MIKYVKKLNEIGIDSLKIEGRTKSLYYVSAVSKIYRKVLDNEMDVDFAFNELKKVGNRGYSEGFFLNNNDCESYSYDISKGLAGSDFLGIVQKKVDNNIFRVLIKNKIQLNDEIEIITPNYQVLAFVKSIIHDKKGQTDTANTNDEINLELISQNNDWQKEFEYALLRTKGLKEY